MYLVQWKTQLKKFERKRRFWNFKIRFSQTFFEDSSFNFEQENKMCLITFETKAKICLRATQVNDMGKNIIFDEFKKMRPGG